MIDEICSIIPITNIIIETGEFDPHKLKNPDIRGKEYQEGDNKY